MNISGGHINPAITLSMLATKRISVRNAVLYIVAQVIGATIGGYMLFGVFPNALGVKVNWGAPGLSSQTSIAQGILFEAVMTFILAFAVFGTAVDSRAPEDRRFRDRACDCNRHYGRRSIHGRCDESSQSDRADDRFAQLHKLVRLLDRSNCWCRDCRPSLSGTLVPERPDLDRISIRSDQRDKNAVNGAVLLELPF